MNIIEGYDNEVSRMTERELRTYIASKGKRANQRLRQLEESQLENSSAAYRYIRKMARDENIAYTKTARGEIKFRTATRGMTQGELRHQASEIAKFLEAKTSTVKGIRGSLEKAKKTFEESHPNVDISLKDFGEAMTYTVFRKFEKLYGSDIAIKIMERAKGLNTDEIELALMDAAFDPNAKYTDTNPKPSVKSLYDSIDRYNQFKEDLGGEDVGAIFGEYNPLE